MIHEQLPCIQLTVVIVSKKEQITYRMHMCQGPPAAQRKVVHNRAMLLRSPGWAHRSRGTEPHRGQGPLPSHIRAAGRRRWNTAPLLWLRMGALVRRGGTILRCNNPQSAMSARSEDQGSFWYSSPNMQITKAMQT